MTWKHSHRRGKNAAAAMLLVLFLLLAGPVFAGDDVVSPTDKEIAVTGDQDCNSVIALLQEQQKDNAHEFRQMKRELAILRQQLESPGISEILGGIGYIVGLFGVAAYVMSRKNTSAGKG